MSHCSLEEMYGNRESRILLPRPEAPLGLQHFLRPRVRTRERSFLLRARENPGPGFKDKDVVFSKIIVSKMHCSFLHKLFIYYCLV